VVALALLLPVGTWTDSRLTLVERGQPRAVIVLGENPSAQARQAAAELQTILRRISGAELPVAEAPPAAPGAKVLVGQGAGREAAAQVGLPLPTGLKADFNDEGYVIATGPDTLILAGNETEPYQGTFYAVYDLLHGLGCRWFFPGEFGEVIPKLETVTISPTRRTVRPELRVRDIWYSGHLPVSGAQAQEFAVWKRRNRLCQSGFWAAGGPFLQNPGDDSTYRLLPKEKYWAAHPEYYALNPNGSRNERFLCMSHPGALQAAADTVVEYFKEHPAHFAFAFSPPDEPVLCNCAECKAAMHAGYGGEGYGDVSDPYFQFVFKLAEQVGKVCPDRWITTMAYYNRCRPPEGVEGRRPNLLIQLASIQQCSLHSYADRNCWSRQMFGAMLRRWAELSARQVFYEYDPHDWGHLQRPAWRGQGIAEDLRLLKRLGGWGFSNEGQMAWLSTGLNYYLHARLAWDLKEDPAQLEADFADKFFGPAAKPMLQYYAAVEQRLRSAGVHYPLGYDPDGPGDDLYTCLDWPLFDRSVKLFWAAAPLATAEPFKTRVAAFWAHMDRLSCGLKARQAMARGDYAQAAKWGEAMIETVRRVNNSALLQDVGPYGGRLSGSNVVAVARRLGEYAHGPKGKLLAVLGATALFRTDPGPDGVVQRWYLPGLDTTGWKQVRLTTGWHHQGFVTAEGRRFNGLGWYRCALKLPAAPPDKLGLCLPEVRGSAVWVWCNGRFAGYWERTKQGERHLDISGLLRAGDNLLVFRVKGEGGFTLPPFLFTPQPGPPSS